jgi:hypothetical protein
VIAGADDPGDRPVGSHLLDEAATNDVDVIGVDQIGPRPSVDVVLAHASPSSDRDRRSPSPPAWSRCECSRSFRRSCAHTVWNGEPFPVLAAAPSAAQPSPESLARLQHAYALREELDPAWTARPSRLEPRGGRLRLPSEDPAASPSRGCSGGPGTSRRFCASPSAGEPTGFRPRFRDRVWPDLLERPSQPFRSWDIFSTRSRSTTARGRLPTRKVSRDDRADRAEWKIEVLVRGVSAVREAAKEPVAK